MPSRVSAWIEIGGTITAEQYRHLASLIADEDLSVEWDGEPFDPSQLKANEPLILCAHEVSLGEFTLLERWCQAQGIAYGRWSAGRPGEWDAHRVVFKDAGDPTSYPSDDGAAIVMTEAMARELGTLDSIMSFFAAGNFAIPPLIVNEAE